MKVVAFNGSPKAKGNTYHAIRMVADEAEEKASQWEVRRIVLRTSCMKQFCELHHT